MFVDVLHLIFALINVMLYVYDCEICWRRLYRNLFNADIHIFLLQISQSNAWTVALQDVQRELTGFYKCEVSADAPLFHTEIKTGLMIVVGKKYEARDYHDCWSHVFRCNLVSREEKLRSFAVTLPFSYMNRTRRRTGGLQQKITHYARGWLYREKWTPDDELPESSKHVESEWRLPLK